MEQILATDGEVWLEHGFVAPDAARQYMRSLSEQIQWQHETLVLFGKVVPVPRRVAYYGDASARYTYSGREHRPRPWTPLLAELRERVEQAARTEFNSVLANLYRDGRDSMGWHADDEPELGRNPVIGSLSFGASRTFKVRHRRSGQRRSIPLHSGSLLVMRGPFQHHWQHAVPKSRRVSLPRINLTFRWIQNAGEGA